MDRKTAFEPFPNPSNSPLGQGCIKLTNLELIPHQGLIYLPQNFADFEHEYSLKCTSEWMIGIFQLIFQLIPNLLTLYTHVIKAALVYVNTT